MGAVLHVMEVIGVQVGPVPAVPPIPLLFPLHGVVRILHDEYDASIWCRFQLLSIGDGRISLGTYGDLPLAPSHTLQKHMFLGVIRFVPDRHCVKSFSANSDRWLSCDLSRPSPMRGLSAAVNTVKGAHRFRGRPGHRTTGFDPPADSDFSTDGGPVNGPNINGMTWHANRRQN